MEIELEAGKTYYFWPVSSGVNISSVIFKADPISYDDVLSYNAGNYTVTPQLAGDLIIARYNDDNSLKDTQIKTISANEAVRVTEEGKYKVMLWNSVSEMKPIAAAKEFTIEPSENSSPLSRKAVYAFGDSIIYGHTAQSKSFMRLIAKETEMSLGEDGSNDSRDSQPTKEYMYAVNGATVTKSSNDILTQVNNASALKPDLIVFDGYTNDSYIDGILSRVGTIQGKNATVFDETTFCGAFEKILYTMRQKWGEDVPIVYVTIHKSYGNWEEKSTLCKKAIEMCNEWGVTVADMFNDGKMDTRQDNKTDDEWSAYMKKYIIGGMGTHPNETAVREFYMPIIKPVLENAVSEAENEE